MKRGRLNPADIPSTSAAKATKQPDIPSTSATTHGSRSTLTRSGKAQTIAPSSSPNNSNTCECGRQFDRLSSLVLHQKECNRRDRTRCQHCPQHFPTYQGVRQHERRAHPEQYHKELAEQLPASEDTLLKKIAAIEAKSINGKFYAEMIATTGLTQHQIRHRREKENYKRYLEKARGELVRESKTRFTMGQHRPQPTGPPTTPRSLRAKKREMLRTGSFEENADVIFIPADTNTESAAQPRQLTPVHEESRGGSPVETPTLTHAIIHSPTTPTSTPPLQPSQRQRLSRRISSSLNDLGHSGTQAGNEEEAPSWFSSLLEHIKENGSETEISELTGILLEASDLTGQELQTFIDSWVDKLFVRSGRNRPGPKINRPSNRPAYGQSYTGSGRRAANFKKAQDLFNKSRKTLAHNIISGRPLSEHQDTPNVESVERFYGGILESNSPEDHENFESLPTICEMWTLISAEEVANAKLNWTRSAPGPDGVTIDSVKKISNLTLSILFSIILFKNIHPTPWRKSRSILIHKDGDTRDPSNWRPITISSAAQRLLHRIISRRFREYVKPNQNQRGFTAVDGTLANTMVLNGYIKERTELGRPYCVASLDIRKAFDTVSHNSISRAMRRVGIPDGLAAYVLETLDSSTTFCVSGQKSREIRIKRGVKQGDPLSPTLFNIVMDELLNNLNANQSIGGTLGPLRCAAMAYADDMVLLEDDENKLSDTLHQVEVFCRNRGMELNPKKSKCLVVTVFQKKHIPRQKPMFKVGGVGIPMLPACDTFRFLGHEFNSTGFMKPTLPNLPGWLYNVCRAPLKPDQRLIVLRDYVIPRLTYGLQNPKVTSRDLRDADRLVKSAVKRILHLHLHTADAALHASIRDGGLGIMELRTAIPRIFLSRLVNLLARSEDEILSYVLQTESIRALMTKLSSMAGDIPETQKWKECLRASPILTGVELTSEDPSSRSWLLDKPRGWTGRDYVRAVHLRSGNLPTKAIPSNPVGERRCRAGCDCDESLPHVLQQCPTTHGYRINRHNEIVNKIASHCKSRWPTEDEPHIRHPDGQLFKPDLAIHLSESRVVVCDIQVSWEGRMPMRDVWENKRRVYDNPKFREAAHKYWTGKELIFSPIIVGARGIWPRCNESTEIALQLPVHLKRSCVQSALKWGCSIHGLFMRSVWE